MYKDWVLGKEMKDRFQASTDESGNFSCVVSAFCLRFAKKSLNFKSSRKSTPL